MADVYVEGDDDVKKPKGTKAVKENAQSNNTIEQSNNTIEQDQEEIEDDEVSVLPTINPLEILGQGNTFLHKYLEVAKGHPTPIEYHLFLGLQALGLAVGNRVQLFDDDNVKANLAVILLGDTTAGKSRAARPVIQEFLQHDTSSLKFTYKDINDNIVGTGVKYVNGAGSGEAVIEQFDLAEKETKVNDPNDTTGNTEIKIRGRPIPVSGLVYFNELSYLSAKSNSSNSAFKPIMMAFIDGESRVGNITRTHGELTAYKPFASFLSTTQPKDLRNTLTKSDIAKGMVNRFLFICGAETESRPIGRTLLDWQTPRKALEEVYDWSYTLDPTGREPFLIESFEAKAYEKFEKFYLEKIRPAKVQDSKHGTGVLGRIDLHFKRLILLAAINDMSPRIAESHVDFAILLFDFLVDCYAVVGGGVVTSEITDAMEKILAVITKLESKKDENGEPTTQCTYSQVYTRRLKRYGMTVDVWTESIGKLLRPGGGLYRNKSGRKDGRGGRTSETFNTYKKM